MPTCFRLIVIWAETHSKKGIYIFLPSSPTFYDFDSFTSFCLWSYKHKDVFIIAVHCSYHPFHTQTFFFFFWLFIVVSIALTKRIFFFFFKINLLIYFWLHWVCVAAHWLSLVAVSGGYFSLQCPGFSLRWLLLLQSTGCRCTGFSSCGSWSQ